MLRVLCVALAFASAGTAALADWSRRGTSSGLNNDYFGDNADRWQTASYSRSWIDTRPAEEALSGPFGTTRIMRLRGQIMTPRRLNVVPGAGERPYAGYTAVGLFSDTEWRGNVVQYGAELGIRGPSSGMGAVHRTLHGIMGENEPQGWGGQLGDRVYLTPMIEVTRRGAVQPFFAVQAGVETLARVGVDATFGPQSDGPMTVREPITGHRPLLRARGEPEGMRLTVGVDAAWVVESGFLPDGSTVVAEDTRLRARAAFSFPTPWVNVTYGLAYLSPEFTTQPEGQVLGTLDVSFDF